MIELDELLAGYGDSYGYSDDRGYGYGGGYGDAYGNAFSYGYGGYQLPTEAHQPWGWGCEC